MPHEMELMYTFGTTELKFNLYNIFFYQLIMMETDKFPPYNSRFTLTSKIVGIKMVVIKKFDCTRINSMLSAI